MSKRTTRQVVPVRLPSVRRDRHGRGMRGPLAPQDSPATVSRARRFDDYVLESVERLDRRWQEQLRRVEYAVEDVPSLDDWDRDWIPLARAFTAVGALPPRIVVYRRPIESRVAGPRQLRMLIHDVVVEQVAELLGIEPHEVDPAYTPRD